jgi:type 2 lantibiotic (TIGR03893 family)
MDKSRRYNTRLTLLGGIFNMTQEEIKVMNQSCGNGLRSLTMEEMQNIYGASDVDPRGTPATIPAISKIVSAITKSTKPCLSAIGSAISGIVSNNKNCLG